MKAESLRVAKVFQNGGDIHFILPSFQREYSWERLQWETLLADAIALHDEMQSPGDTASSDLEHFLGSIVVINGGTVNGTVPVFQVVDGQQRLTSISLLLCALERVAGMTVPGMAKKVRRLLINEDEKDGVRYKLLPTAKHGDRSAYTAVIEGKEGVTSSDGSRVPAAFQYFRNELSRRITAGQVDPGRLFLVLTQAFTVVFISLNRDENPYRIFESVNAKGKPLTQADLVRNYIAMRLSPMGQERIFNEHWAPIEERLQEQRIVGRSRLGELTAFLRHYLAMRTGVLCSEEHVYARFRDRAEREFPEEESFAEEIAALNYFSVLYERLLRSEKETSPEARAAMMRLNSLESTTAYPFLLAASDARESGVIEAEQWCGIIDVLENYLVRRFLAGEPANFLNKVFPSLWELVEPAKPVESLKSALVQKNYPRDSRVRQRLSARSMYDSTALTRNRTAFILERVNRHCSIGTGGYAVLDGAATIEHVLPQSAGQDWTDDLGPDAERIVRERLHTLGNLTLVTAEWNGALSNKSFAIKRQKLAGHALKLNSDYFSNDIEVWDEAAIQKRGEWLADKILEIWPSFTADEEPTESIASAVAASFHADCITRISTVLKTPLLKKNTVWYSSPDNRVRITCAVSKLHARSSGSFY